MPVQVRPPAFFIFAAVVELADTMGLGPIGKPCRFPRSQEVGLVLLVGQIQLAHDGFQQVLAVRRLIDRKRIGKADP